MIEDILAVVEEFTGVPGVRGALLANSSGAMGGGRGSGLDAAIADDVAKTVRRMVVASSTVGAPLEELLINFGAARMLAFPIREDATLVILLERDRATAPVRSLVAFEADRLRGLLAELSPGTAKRETVAEGGEVERLLAGELGPVLQRIQDCFLAYAEASTGNKARGSVLMSEQLQVWVQCCSPSAFTFPLLLDGLAQSLGDASEERSAFVDDAQQILRSVGVWASSGQ